MKTHTISSLAEPVGKIWQTMQSKTDDDFYVASPLSNTPLPVYDWVARHANEFTNWDKTKFVLMDEMLQGEKDALSYVPITNRASYEGFARKHFLDKLEREIGFTLPVIKPDLQTIERFQTPIDLLILALGPSGNYANVMPGTPLKTGWHIAKLSEEFRQKHTTTSGAYGGANFRKYGMSLRPQQVLSAKQVIILINGEKKKELTKQLLSYKNFDPQFPLSITSHDDIKDRVELFITENAYER